VSFDPTDPRNELYARPAEYWKVFVSSKMAGGAFAAERAAAVEAIDAFPLSRAWAWERDADAGPYCSEPECVRHAGTSDALVLILGDELTPVTRKEYDAAYAAGAPIFVLLQAQVPRDDELQKFVALARERGVTVNFSSLGELATHITRAIRTWALRSGRSELLRTRAELRETEPAQAAGDFRDIEIGFGEDGEPVPIRDVVADAERHVAEARPTDAADLLWDIAQGAWEAGLGWLTLDLLDELERLVPAETLDQTRQGWILNTRGLALSQAERHDEAVAAFTRMRQNGRALGDLDLESTALQNLGVQDVIAERPAESGAAVVGRAGARLVPRGGHQPQPATGARGHRRRGAGDQRRRRAALRA
jgi:hypothetical protein